MRAGGAYYPKLQLAVPFTPVPGPRLLLRDPGQAAALIAAAETLTRDHGLSSAHATFIAPDQLNLFEKAGRSEEHTSELQSLMRISYAVFCLKKKNNNKQLNRTTTSN